MADRRSKRVRFSALRGWLVSDAGGGVLLIAVAAAALLVANSPAAPAYFATLEHHLGPLSLLHWINDGLMALFFLLVGLEVKRELLDGALAHPRRRTLPAIAAAGGMAAPALAYLIASGAAPEALRGWAIPAATDIAFTLGVLSLLGRRVPVSLKIFVTALAIIDDLGAVVIIALFYSSELSWLWLAAVLALLGLLYALNRLGVRRLAPYLLVGIALWVATFLSGVHATLAGVALALAIPLRRSPGRPDDRASPLHRLEHGLQPWVAFGVVPLFGFANAGVALGGVSWASLASPITLGTACGLFLGKQIGVFGATWTTLRLGLAERPEGASLRQIHGVAVLCGIGFTMSLFIGLLAFASPAEHDAVKLGVLLGSFASALLGTALLIAAPRSRRRPA